MSHIFLLLVITRNALLLQTDASLQLKTCRCQTVIITAWVSKRLNGEKVKSAQKESKTNNNWIKSISASVAWVLPLKKKPWNIQHPEFAWNINKLFFKSLFKTHSLYASRDASVAKWVWFWDSFVEWVPKMVAIRKLLHPSTCPLPHIKVKSHPVQTDWSLANILNFLWL